MAKIIERLPQLRNQRRKSEKWIRDLIAEKRGAYKTAGMSLSDDLRLLAVCDYVLDHNVVAFRAKLSESVQLVMEIIQRYDRGEPID